MTSLITVHGSVVDSKLLLGGIEVVLCLKLADSVKLVTNHQVFGVFRPELFRIIQSPVDLWYRVLPHDLLSWSLVSKNLRKLK